MTFPLKNFWRLIPYGIYAILIYEQSLFLLLLLAVSLSVSLFKSDVMNRQKLVVVSYVLFVIEIMLLSYVGMENSRWLAAWMIVPVVDWVWRTASPHRLNRIIASVFGIGIIVLSGDVVVSLFILGASYWVGYSLGEMELKKVKAQEYYDRLRISEEALRKANEELKAYYETLEEVTVLRERTRISREIHDSVGHALSTTLIQLHAIKMRLEKEAPSQTMFIDKLVVFISSALENTREVVHNMGNEAQKNHHLKHELAELCHNFSELTQVMVTLTFPEHDPDLGTGHKQVLFRVVQESLTNAVKHGQATKIKVVLAMTNNRVLLTIQDNGRGTTEVIEGFGHKIMRERIKKLSGEIEFISEANKGFTVKASLPGVCL